MNITSSATTLMRFRDELYPCFGMRRAALFALLEAVLSVPQGESLVGLSLAPGFARGWASTCDALSDGSLDVPAIQRVLVSHLEPVPRCGDREVWALDGSNWARPTAPTSPERTSCRVLVSGSRKHSLVDGWEYQWLVRVPEAAGSWVLPLSVERRSPTAGTPTTLAINQVRQVQAARAATGTDAARPLLLLDSSYAVGQLVAADLGVDLLARLAATRVFRRPAPPWKGIGRLPRHGAPFSLADPTTHGEPDATTVIADAEHGPITCARWDRLHDERQPGVELSVIRIQVAHYAPRAHRRGAPKPLWLVWAGMGEPPDPAQARQWYARRFAIEHAFRFLKQTLGWTTPHVRHPQAADRWSWLVALALWQLWLAREVAVPERRPWERRLPTLPPAPPSDAVPGDTRPGDPIAAAPVPGDPERRFRPTPGQVRRACASLFATLGTPAPPPRPRGNAPGRQRGQAPGRAQRFPAVKRGPPDPTSGSRAPP
ncbi:MAG: hypothetical protein M3Z20_13445 [Chloroflexota bacterium]|nr:hypothetical protein [Chloroflexota bacterium]